MSDPTDALTVQFLTFVAEGGRSYAETMDAWRTSCPRMSIWEDALIEGLVRIEPLAGATSAQSRVILTAAGRARLDGAGQIEPKIMPAALRAGAHIR